MQKFLSFFCFLVAACSNAAFAQKSAKIQEANLFMDTVLREAQMIVKSQNIDQAVLQPFEFQVKGTGLSRYLKVKIERATMRGLRFGPSRAGNCSAPRLVGSNVTVSCDIRLNGVDIVSSGAYKGSIIFALTKPITIFTNFIGGIRVCVKATSYPNATAVLQSLQIDSQFHFSNIYHAPKGLDLNDKQRKTEIEHQLANNLRAQITERLEFYYRPVLNLSMNKLRFPTV